MAQIWIARNPGNWSLISVTVKKPTKSTNNLWSMRGTGMEISTTGFQAIFGWLPEPGSLHFGELELSLLEEKTE